MTDSQSVAARLPGPRDLERRCMALAMLDALLSPEWESRYYSFNRRWSPESGTRMASMRNGSGDDFFILFFPDGSAALKGFAHESRALDGKSSSLPGVFDGLPERFAAFANEPAFSMEATTFCLWSEGGPWQRSRVINATKIAADGSGELLALLAGSPADYVAFARDYFEREVAEEAVARFYALEVLTSDLASSLHEEASLDPIAEDIDQIGYPAAG